ncbi:hypothetical protein DITRI_Ditri11bG0031100 [Diplodiscus trichospermus]
MAFQKRKGDFLLAFAVMIILLEANGCRAALLVKSNTTYHCNGRLDECRIAADVELEFGLVMNANIIRILQGGSNLHPGVAANNPHKPAFPCKNQPNSNCIANGDSPPPCKNNYSCGKQAPKK